jgi:uncharacterized RDD family membrane protein YckC
VTWKQASIRFCVAILSLLSFGLGFIWQWLSKDKLSWHDLLSGTQLILHKPDKR